MNIYIIGGMGSGKTTVADYLAHYLPNAKRLTLAEPIKQIIANLDNMSDSALLDNFILPYYNPNDSVAFQIGIKGEEYNNFIAEWSKIFFETRYIKKDGKKERKRLQFLGTDGARNKIDNDIWIKIALEKANKSPEVTWIIDDCRFVNEAGAFEQASWIPIYLHIEPENQIKRLIKLYGNSFDKKTLKHQSETDLKKLMIPVESIFVSYEDQKRTLGNIKKYIWEKLHLY